MSTCQTFRWLAVASWAFAGHAACERSALGATQIDRRPSGESVLVVVNGVPITENRVAFYRLVRRLPEDRSPDVQKKLLDEMVDEELMRQFLADRRAEVDPKRLAIQIDAVKDQLRQEHRDPEKTFKSLGYNLAALRRDLSLPLAWQTHFDRVATQQMLRDEFEARREQYDGTEIRASQILLKVPAADSGPRAREATARLAKIRADIVGGKTTFAEAARKHSEAPSAAKGGDVGYFPFSGKMPAAIARVAFALKVGEVSQPFRTPFGVHLYTVTERRPGPLSLEDARPVVLRRLSKNLWQNLLSQMRAKAKIEWKTAKH
jgi:hypothetical protein